MNTGVSGERTGLREQPATMSEAHDCAHIPVPRHGIHRGVEPPEGPALAPNLALSMVLQEHPCPIGEGTPLPTPQLLPVLRTESVAGTTANAQWASTASKSKFKHTDVNTRMTMKNQVKKQVDDP